MSELVIKHKVIKSRRWIVGGLALFSMFFGAGNVIFPLILGKAVMGEVFWALLGLFCTAIIIPFVGLMASILYEGDYKKFFNRMGKVPGQILIFIIMCVLGPFGAIPRCISLTYSTISVYLPGIPVVLFSALFAFVIYACCVKKRRIIDIIGSYMTPPFFILLGVMIVGAFFSYPGGLAQHCVTSYEAFGIGILEGYNTMDLLATFFFSAIVYERFKADMENQVDSKSVSKELVKASILGAFLLAFVYIGLTLSAAVLGPSLSELSRGQYLGEMGYLIFGTLGGVIIGGFVLLSCLTTAIALSSVTGEYLQEKVFQNKIPYKYILIGVLTISILISTLEFSGILALLAPVLQVFYPSLLTLCVLNIFYKLFGIKIVKVPVYAVLVIILIISFCS
jgi:LIVCS family branched-chain amino acid:cation transporter